MTAETGDNHVSTKLVLSLIKYHAEGEFEKARDVAFEIAKELDNEEISQYIFVQYYPSSGWVPM